MGIVLDLVEQFFERAQHDGSLFLDPALDIFKPVAEEQPLFARWRQYSMEEESLLAPDGVTKHLVWKEALAELITPVDETNIATRAKCIEYLEVQCVAALRKLHDPKLALHDHLTKARMVARAAAIRIRRMRISSIAMPPMMHSRNRSSARMT